MSLRREMLSVLRSEIRFARRHIRHPYSDMWVAFAAMRATKRWLPALGLRRTVVLLRIALAARASRPQLAYREAGVRRLRVLIDGRALGNGRGISVYVSNVLSQMSAISDVDVVTCVQSGAQLNEVAPMIAGCEVAILPGGQWGRAVRWMWSAGLRWPRVERWVGPVDVIHETDVHGVGGRGRYVATIHDTAALDHPALYSATSRVAQWLMLKRARRAEIVVTVSEATAGSLMRRGISRDKIRHIAPPSSICVRSIPRQLAGEAPVVLMVGAVVPSKGITDAVVAFATAVREIDGAQLVLCGSTRDRRYLREVRGVIRACGLQDQVRILGYVSDESLKGWWDRASVYLCTSYAEGYGLPFDDALLRDLAIVATRLSPFLERAKPEHSIYWCAPGDRGAIADALIEALRVEPRPRSGQCDVRPVGRASASGLLTAYKIAAADGGSRAHAMDGR